MARTKLKKFDELKFMNNVIQPNRNELLNNEFKWKGKWSKKFKNSNPIVLELGCGKGEYCIQLSKMYPHLNFIGIDIKGSRIYSGAKIALEENRTNVLFVRAQIDLLSNMFSENEIKEIWITFPDPQIKYNRRNKRLTSNNFLKMYKSILSHGGCVNLKTDSLFLHGYTLGLLEAYDCHVHFSSADIYSLSKIDNRLKIKTYYEKMFLKENLPISHIRFSFL